MASSSKSLDPDDASTRIGDLEYLYASNANVSNFVSVKLSGNQNYRLWKAQMICLMETHDMRGLINDAIDERLSALSPKIRKQYESLLKGWIFGSVSEAVLGTVIDLDSAKDVWDKLKSFCDSSMCFRKDLAKITPEAKIESEDKNISTETETKLEGAVSAEIETEDSAKIETKDKNVSTDTKTKLEGPVSTEIEIEGEHAISIKTQGEDTPSTEAKTKKVEEKMKKDNERKELRKATIEGNWREVRYILGTRKGALTEPINDSDKNTVLHLAVEIGHDDFIKKLLGFIKKEVKVLETTNVDGSTALHVAAIVGNKYAAKLLVEKHKTLLTIEDNERQEPLSRAYSNMQFDTFTYLMKAANDDGQSKHAMSQTADHIKRVVNLLVNAISAKHYTNDDGQSKHAMSQTADDIKRGVNLLVNAISAKQYTTALELVENFPKFAVENVDVLMAIARSFPCGLNEWETIIYPSMDNTSDMTLDRALELFIFLVVCSGTMALYKFSPTYSIVFVPTVTVVMSYIVEIFLLVLLITYMWLRGMARVLVSTVYFLLFLIHFPLWKVATRLGRAIRHIEKKKKEWEEAKKILKFVCDEIDKLEFSGTYHPYYEGPIFEAVCQNAHQVVEEILFRSPEVIKSKDNCGYDIIQLAVIHRSERIYNLIYQIGRRKSNYRMMEDTSENNILHLAGRLAPPRELNRRTGAALQLQRELQWREELKKIVLLTYITKENIFKETPDMVFTREHKELMKEGQSWMKNTAKSCSITAALITTIVFAAAISVPGGSNAQNGISIFTQDIAFTVFAISNAISLFTSTTSLLVFLSILTARFAEQDFLVSLPKRLIIGLCSLFFSTVALMVAFSATLFLVFCEKNPWMLIPICASACVPIVLFLILQFPLIVDLYLSTYVPIFGKKSNSQLVRLINPGSVRGFLYRLEERIGDLLFDPPQVQGGK